MGRIRITCMLFILFLLLTSQPIEASSTFVPAGINSLPARIFANRNVCLVDTKNPAVCQKKLMKIPRRIINAHFFTFHGVFDIEGKGSPDIFLEYCSPFDPKNSDQVTLLVYKKIQGKYRQYLKLKAESYGYDPGAWFINELPYPKAIFMARSGGSSGSGLFYLNLKKKSLDLISGSIFLEGNPEFVDLDGDGISEIFLPGRGRDRTSIPGAAILKWKDDGYQMWWPDWTGIPNVIYATLVDMDNDGKKEIVAVLEPEQTDLNLDIDGKTSGLRELATWKVTPDGYTLVSKIKLPNSRFLSEPFFNESSTNSGIELTYSRTVNCSMKNGKMECRDDADKFHDIVIHD